MKEAFKENNWFYLPYLLLLVCCSSVLLIWGKADVHIWLNQHQPTWLDPFFKAITNLGDGISLPFFLLIMLFISFRYSLLMTGGFLVSGLFVQVLKHSLFHNMVRPVKFFENTYSLHLVEGVKPLYYNSFPSGHSASAFVFFLCFAMAFKQKPLKIVMLLCAVLVAYSRVYLSQHFLMDTLGGSLLGVLTVFAGSLWVNRLPSGFDKTLYTITRKK